jgi:hypothetical protein
MRARLPRRAKSLPPIEITGEIEHHAPAQAILLAQDPKHGGDPVISSVAQFLRGVAVAHIRADVAM